LMGMVAASWPQGLGPAICKVLWADGLMHAEAVSWSQRPYVALACCGGACAVQHVEHALERGAIETLLVSDVLLRCPDPAQRRRCVLAPAYPTLCLAFVGVALCDAGCTL